MNLPLQIRLAGCGFALALFVSLPSLRAQAPGPASSPPSLPQRLQAQDDAQAAASTWLKLTDNGQYVESWQAAAGLFHQAITQDGWVTLLKSGLPVFGKVVTRKLKTTTFTNILPGAPDGEYVVVLYDTQFSNMGAAVETLATVREAGGNWKVCGYHIK